MPIYIKYMCQLNDKATASQSECCGWSARDEHPQTCYELELHMHANTDYERYLGNISVAINFDN